MDAYSFIIQYRDELKSCHPSNYYVIDPNDPDKLREAFVIEKSGDEVLLGLSEFEEGNSRARGQFDTPETTGLDFKLPTGESLEEVCSIGDGILVFMIAASDQRSQKQAFFIRKEDGTNAFCKLREVTRVECGEVMQTFIIEESLEIQPSHLFPFYTSTFFFENIDGTTLYIPQKKKEIILLIEQTAPRFRMGMRIRGARD